MREGLKQIAVALGAAIAASIGTALGAYASDEIKKRWPAPVPPTKRKRSKLKTSATRRARR